MPQIPKVSIVTISFNAEKFIERTIQSVIKQSYSNIEYIVIDGNSTDNTVNIIKQYESQIDFWMSEPDKSLYDAMNKGLEKATGEYVLFMNAGDKIHEENSLQEIMEGHNNTDLIYAKAEHINKEGVRRPWHKKTPKPSKLKATSFLNGMVICHHCIIVKKTIALSYKLHPWKVSNDIEWAIRVMKKTKTIHYWDETFCLYLEGGLSAKNRITAVKERFNIAVLHFGWRLAVLAQIKIFFRIIQRGRIS